MKKFSHLKFRIGDMTTSRRLPGGKVRLTHRLYESIIEHHKQCLKALFFKYYEPLPDGNHDMLWVTRLPTSEKHQLRLHLSVVRRGDLFDWTDQEIGPRVINRIHSLIY